METQKIFMFLITAILAVLVLNTVSAALCSSGIQNATGLTLDIEIDVDSDGEGDEGEWFPRDIVEVIVELDNNKVIDLDTVYFELDLLNADNESIAGDLDWIEGDEKEKIGDIDEDDDEEYSFKFYVPNDVDADDYDLVIKAYEDDNEDLLCIDNNASTQVEISKETDEDRFFIFEDLELSSTTVECGTEVTVTTTMYSIGDEERQDAVKVNLYSTQIDIDMYSEVFTRFDNDEKQELEFIFTVPTNETEGIYKLSLVALYDYDEDDDEDETYEDTYFNEKTAAEKVSLTLDGMCSDSSDAKAIVDVALSEDTPTARVGREVIMVTTIENTGTGEGDYKVSLSGVSAWADATIEESEFTLEAGESKEVEIVLDIDNDVEAGEKEFTIITTYGESTKDQDVILDIAEGSSLSLIGSHFKDNWFIYTVILVDVILIAAIIIAVVRISKKPRA